MAYNLYLKLSFPSKIRQLNIGNIHTSNIKLNGNIILQIASVLGMEFEKNVLKLLYFKASGKELNRGMFQYFDSKDETLIFKNNETIEKFLSNMGKNILSSLHQLAAETYEELYGQNIKEYIGKILHHYKLSNNTEKHREYLWLQAQEYILNYQYADAKIAYFQLLELEQDIKEKSNLIMKIGDVYRNASEWNEEIKLYEKYLLIFSGYYRDELIIRLCELYILKGMYDKYNGLLRKLSRKEKHSINTKLEIIKANHELNKGNYDVALKIIDNLLLKTNGNLYSEILSLKGIIIAKQHNYDESIEIHKLLYKSSEDTNDKQMMVKSLINIAEGYFYKGDYTNAYGYYELALRISKKMHRKNAEAICLGNLGTINYVRNEYDLAISFFVKQLRIFNLIGNRNGIANAYGMLGACMISIGKFKKALYYLNNQHEIVLQLKAKKSLAICLGNMGVIYNLTGEFDLAIKHFEKQLQIDYDIKNYEGIFRALGNIGNQYFYKGKYNISKKYLSKAITIANKHGINLNLESVLCHYSAVLFELREFKQSEIYALKASELSVKVNNTLIKITSDIIKEKAILYSNAMETSTVKACCQRILLMKDLSENKEVIALIYYELWKIEKTSGLPFNLHKKLAIKHYSLLYKEVSKFEFRQKLIQLTS